MIPARFSLPHPEDTRALGRAVGRAARAGDLIVLTGGLGAGKTTLTQGIAAGLGIDEGVVSPTFIIARAHRAGARGIPLVHADAYRLGSLTELDHLDLDESLDESVTVVEWGEALAEALAESWLHVSLDRGRGAPEGEDPEAGARTATVEGYGPRWDETHVAAIGAALA